MNYLTFTLLQELLGNVVRVLGGGKVISVAVVAPGGKPGAIGEPLHLVRLYICQLCIPAVIRDETKMLVLICRLLLVHHRSDYMSNSCAQSARSALLNSEIGGRAKRIKQQQQHPVSFDG